MLKIKIHPLGVIFAILMVTFVANVNALDLTPQQEASLMGLVNRAKQEMQIPSEAGTKPSLNQEHIGWAVVFLVENGIVGDRCASFLKAVSSDLGNSQIPYSIQFSNERSKMIKALFEDAVTNYGPDSRIASASLPPSLIGKTRYVSELLTEAYWKLEQKTGYKFPDHPVILEQ